MTNRFLTSFLFVPLFFSIHAFGDSVDKSRPDSTEKVAEFTMENVSNINEAKMAEFKKSLENSMQNFSNGSKMSLDSFVQFYLNSAQSIVDHPEEFRKAFDHYGYETAKKNYDFLAKSGTFTDVSLSSNIEISPDEIIGKKIVYKVIEIKNIDNKNFNCQALFKFNAELSTMRIYGTGDSISCLDANKNIVMKKFSGALIDNDVKFGLGSSLVIKNHQLGQNFNGSLVFDSTRSIKILFADSIVLPSIKSSNKG